MTHISLAVIFFANAHAELIFKPLKHSQYLTVVKDV